MFSFNTSEPVIPSLTFTKAELVYIVSVILSDIKPTDDHTKVEMVEMRYYVNKIKDKVVYAAHNGELTEPSFSNESPHKEDKKEEPVLPPIEELKKQFPTLSEVEIEEILRRSRQNAIEESRKNKENVQETEKHPNAKPDKTSDDIKTSFIIDTPHSPMHNEAMKFSALLGAN